MTKSAAFQEFGFDSGFHHMVLATAIDTCRDASRAMIAQVVQCVDDTFKRAIERGATLGQGGEAAVIGEIEKVSRSKLLVQKTFVNDIYRHLATVAYKPAAETTVTRKRIGLRLELSGGESLAVMERTEIATAKLAQCIDLHTRGRMEILAGYVSTLRGIKKETSALANVFRGDLFATALRKAIVATEASDEVAAIWLQAASEPMAHGVDEVCQVLLEKLHRSGIDQTQSRESIAQKEIQEMLAALLARASDPLRSCGTGMLLMSNEPNLKNGPSLTVDEGEALNKVHLRLLLTMIAQKVATTDRFDAAIKKAFPGLNLAENHRMQIAALAEVGKSEKSELAQSKEVLAKAFRALLNRAFQNHCVLPSIRAELRKVQPKLESLAKGDASVFVNPEHPIRAFVNELVGHSLAFESESEVGYTLFILPVQEHIRNYLANSGESLKELLKLRLKLKAHWDETTSRHGSPGSKTDKVMAWAEQRNNVAYHLRKDVEANCPNLAKAPLLVRQFVLGPWTHVMATIELNGPVGGLDARTAEKIAHGLVYSTNRSCIIRDRTAIVAKLPTIIRLTQQGCKAIEWDERHPPAVEFFQRLGELHGRLLSESRVLLNTARGDPDAVKKWLAQTIHEGEKRDPSSLNSPDEAASLWFTPSEAMMLGRIEDEIRSQSGADANSVDRGSRSKSDGTVDLPIGSWVEIDKEGIAHRAALQWSNGATQFLFVLKGGSNMTMTARQIRRLISQSRFRVVMSRDIWCQAMESLLDQSD